MIKPSKYRFYLNDSEKLNEEEISFYLGLCQEFSSVSHEVQPFAFSASRAGSEHCSESGVGDQGRVPLVVGSTLLLVWLCLLPCSHSHILGPALLGWQRGDLTVGISHLLLPWWFCNPHPHVITDCWPTCIYLWVRLRFSVALRKPQALEVTAIHNQPIWIQRPM